MAEQRLHKTARGIIVRNSMVLVMRAKGSIYCGLPGGHIDRGEQPIDALIREMREELGTELSYVEWLTKLDFIWDDQQTHELTDLYMVHTWPLHRPLQALESHLAAAWVPTYAVADAGLRPKDAWRWIAYVAARRAV